MEMEDRVKEAAEASVPLRRVGVAEDIANAVVYLAPDESAYVTGEVIDVNGGSYFGNRGRAVR